MVTIDASNQYTVSYTKTRVDNESKIDAYNLQ